MQTAAAVYAVSLENLAVAAVGSLPRVTKSERDSRTDGERQAQSCQNQREQDRRNSPFQRFTPPFRSFSSRNFRRRGVLVRQHDYPCRHILPEYSMESSLSQGKLHTVGKEKHLTNFAPDSYEIFTNMERIRQKMTQTVTCD
jgi:hypothetical protein